MRGVLLALGAFLGTVIVSAAVSELLPDRVGTSLGGVSGLLGLYGVALVLRSRQRLGLVADPYPRGWDGPVRGAAGPRPPAAMARATWRVSRVTGAFSSVGGRLLVAGDQVRFDPRGGRWTRASTWAAGVGEVAEVRVLPRRGGEASLRALRRLLEVRLHDGSRAQFNVRRVDRLAERLRQALA